MVPDSTHSDQSISTNGLDGPLYARLTVIAILLVGVLDVITWPLAANAGAPPIQSDDKNETSTLKNNAGIQLSQSELGELKLKKARFDKMPESKQLRLRQLHRRIMDHQDRDELLAVMQRYNEWIKSLPEKERARLRLLKDDERINEIHQIRQRQAEADFGVLGDTQLPQEDVPKLFEWIKNFMAENSDIILNTMRDSQSRESRGGRRGGWRSTRPDAVFYWLVRHEPDLAGRIVTNEEIQNLRNQLSADAVAIIDNLDNDQERRRLVFTWITTAIRAKRYPQVSTRELMEFYNHEMTPEQRERVDAMSPDERRRRIRTEYIFSRSGRASLFNQRMRRGDDGNRPPNLNDPNKPNAERKKDVGQRPD